MEPPDPRTALTPASPLARRLERYEERPEQQRMLEAVAAALAGGRHLLVEAGTGVGKSFGYLIPALHHASVTGERILVSTRTIALQDQLDRKDLPLLGAVLPYEVSVVVAKGRNNYLCRRRLERAIKTAGGLFADPGAAGRLRQLEEWAGSAAEGSRSDLPLPVPPEVWEQVQAESGNCTQRRCPHYQGCHYQQARRRMESARVVVVNHALYFADLGLRLAGAVYLPAHAAVIFDEAHTIERVATEQLGRELGPGGVEHLLSRLLSERTGTGLLATIPYDPARQAVALARDTARAFFDEVAAWQKQRDPGGGGRLLGDEPFVANSLTGGFSGLADALLQASSLPDLAEDDRLECAHYAQRAAGLARAATLLIDERPAEQVIWVEGRGRRQKLVGAPLEVGGLLAKHLYPALRSCILTSATLAVGDGGFKYLRDRLGLAEADELRLGSPFPFERNVELHLRTDLPDPDQGEKWEEAALDAMKELLLAEGGRGLVLCTSWRLVERARSLAPPLAAAGIACLFQGEGPVQRLVERKRRHDSTVLFGTDSLWEGIDIPGDALTLVLIPRLPFPVPTQPLVQARSRALEKEGRSPFRDYHLPEAILRLRQGFGRLVRTAEDRGRVVLLDPRLVRRPYGRLFLRALPPCPVVVHGPGGEVTRHEPAGEAE